MTFDIFLSGTQAITEIKSLLCLFSIRVTARNARVKLLNFIQMLKAAMIRRLKTMPNSMPAIKTSSTSKNFTKLSLQTIATSSHGQFLTGPTAFNINKQPQIQNQPLQFGPKISRTLGAQICEKTQNLKVPCETYFTGGTSMDWSISLRLGED